jgi:hypothetical protein
MITPNVGDRVSYSIRSAEERVERVAIVASLHDEDGIPSVFVRGEDWQFGHYLNVAAFDPDATDETFIAQVLTQEV